MKRVDLPSLERLRELFVYHPGTGVLEARTDRRTRRGAYFAGDTVGTPDAYGYLKISVDGFPYLAHRVCWKMHTGQEPPPYLDHKNRKKADNRFENLRTATSRQNAVNSVKAAGYHGFRGISGHFAKNGAMRWRACAERDGEKLCFGVFETPQAAAAAWEKEIRELDGEFACTENGAAGVHAVPVFLQDDTLIDAAALVVAAVRSGSPKLAALVADLAGHVNRSAPERYNLSTRKRSLFD